MELDAAAELFSKTKSEFEESLPKKHTEQDIRFRLINRVLTEVLGWEFKEIHTERKNDSGFSDYLIESAGKSRAIVEAKRTSEKLTNSKANGIAFLKIGGSGLDDARAGIEQASDYCIQEGVDYAILTNGTTWICFRAIRTDGKKPSDGKAAIFNSLDTIEQNFTQFFELLAKDHVVNRVYRAILNEAEGFSLSPREDLHFAFEDASIRVDQKTEHARDLEEIFDTFFSTISGDSDQNLLINCFVESKESQLADKVLARITSEILDQLKPVDSSTGGQLARELERAAYSRRGEKILLIGNKGSGKSTFVDRFFNITLSPEIRNQCLFLKIDLARFSGNEIELSNWLDKTLQEEIDKALYSGSPPTYDELQGVFHHIYQRWSTGPHKHLHDSDPTAFKIKFGDFLQKTADEQPNNYCLAQLRNIVRSRKLLPCLVFDNTDQFSAKIQQSVFQYANALFEHVKICFMIVPITDHTIWQLSKSGPLQSYRAKSFFLPVPSTKKILEKRIEYIGSEVNSSERVSGKYTLPNGIQVSLENLKGFVSSLEEVFLKNDFIARRIGYLANFDIRRSLELSKRLMTSPFIGIDRLIAAYINMTTLHVSRSNITLGLVNGQHEKFRQDQSDFILNLFEVHSKSIGSPLLRLRILSLLLDKQRSVNDSLESFLTCSDIEEYFEAMGVPANLTRTSLQKLLETRLIEPYDPTDQTAHAGQRVSLTTSGEMHIEMAMHDSIYFSQMALITGVRDAGLADSIRTDFKSKSPAHLKMEEIKSKFLAYCITQDAIFSKIPSSNPNYETQRALVDELQATLKESGVEARVDWFNPNQGYGFVHLIKKKERAFLSLTVLEEFGVNDLHQRDEIICEIARSTRGYHVTKIENINLVRSSRTMDSPPTDSEYSVTKVVFYNPIKGFGFLKPEGGGRDILLPRRTLNSIGVNEIEEGTRVLAQIEMQLKGPVAVAIALDE